MTVRRCLACQKPARTTDLIPLHLGESGSLRVGRALRGRGGWIHPSCLHSAIERPSALNRAFRARVLDVDELPRRVETWMILTLRRQLHRVLKDGLELKKSAEPPENVALTIRSSHHPDAPNMPEKKPIYSVKTSIFTVTDNVFNQIVDRGPCLELKINAGRSTQSLLRSLRAWDRLG